jgi:hypothetical protein
VVRLLPKYGQDNAITTETSMNTRHLLKTGAQWLGVLILLAAALPLVAVGAWVLRFVLVAAAAVALVSGCMLYCVYPRFRDWTHHVAHPTNEASS